MAAWRLVFHPATSQTGYVLHLIPRYSFVKVAPNPEKGFVKVCIKKNVFEARYDISGSSFRINLGKTYACLLKHEIDYGISKIKAVFKLDGCLMMFYREDEETYYQPHMNRPDYKKRLLLL